MFRLTVVSDYPHGDIERMALIHVGSTVRRIAEQTHQRSVKAIAQNESDDSQCQMWWYRLVALLQSEPAGPMTWVRLQEISKKLVDGTYDTELEGGTAQATDEEVDPTCSQE
jgi:hypothetical protein